MVDVRRRAEIASVVGSFRNAAGLIEQGVRNLRVITGMKDAPEVEGEQTILRWATSLRELANSIEDVES